MLAAVQKHGHALEYASAELMADREVVLAAVQQHGYALRHTSAELRGCGGIVTWCCTTRPQALAQALAPSLALVVCLGGPWWDLAMAQGTTKARQGLVVPWLMETHQG